MGVEYRHYLIPEENDFRPGPVEAARLIAALVEARFVARTEADPFPTPFSYSQTHEYTEGSSCFLLTPADRGAVGDGRPWPSPCKAEDLARLGAGDFRLGWDVEPLETSGLVYPLTEVPDDAYYTLELHFADDFVYETSEQIDPFRDSDVTCCDRRLDYWVPNDEEGPSMFAQRIRRTCPSCGREFRPQHHLANHRHPLTGERRERRERLGGATYRFAVFVDCGKCFPYPVKRFLMNRDLVAIVERTLGRTFYEIGTVY